MGRPSGLRVFSGQDSPPQWQIDIGLALVQRRRRHGVGGDPWRQDHRCGHGHSSSGRWRQFSGGCGAAGVCAAGFADDDPPDPPPARPRRWGATCARSTRNPGRRRSGTSSVWGSTWRYTRVQFMMPGSGDSIPRRKRGHHTLVHGGNHPVRIQRPERRPSGLIASLTLTSASTLDMLKTRPQGKNYCSAPAWRPSSHFVVDNTNPMRP